MQGTGPATIAEAGKGVAEIGRAAADQSDWQTITYFLMVIIIILILERFWYSTVIRSERRDMADERKTMWAVSKEFGEAGKELGENTQKVVTELQVQRELNARSEGVITRLEERVSRLLGSRGGE